MTSQFRNMLKYYSKNLKIKCNVLIALRLKCYPCFHFKIYLMKILSLNVRNKSALIFGFGRKFDNKIFQNLFFYVGFSIYILKQPNRHCFSYYLQYDKVSTVSTCPNLRYVSYIFIILLSGLSLVLKKEGL